VNENALRRGALVVLVLAACAMGAGSATCGYYACNPPAPPTETTIVRPTPDVIVAMRDLARLESASFHMERVIDLRDRQERLFGLVQADDAILMVAAGDVVAGVDLTEMRDGDVVIDPDSHTATITLPPPRVLSTSLDNERTFVHTRSTDTMARRREDLETRARQEAERTIGQSAIEAGILDRARENAGRTIETLVRSLGYQRVEIRWRESEG
jgi:hypothetical protein